MQYTDSHIRFTVRRVDGNRPLCHTCYIPMLYPGSTHSFETCTWGPVRDDPVITTLQETWFILFQELWTFSTMTYCCLHYDTFTSLGTCSKYQTLYIDVFITNTQYMYLQLFTYIWLVINRLVINNLFKKRTTNRCLGKEHLLSIQFYIGELFIKFQLHCVTAYLLYYVIFSK